MNKLARGLSLKLKLMVFIGILILVSIGIVSTISFTKSKSALRVLTEDQLQLIEDRLKENSKEEKELRVKDRKNEAVNPWDFVYLSNEKSELEFILKNKYILI